MSESVLETQLRPSFSTEEVAPGAQPYLPSSAIYREAGWPLLFASVNGGDHGNPYSNQSPGGHTCSAPGLSV